MFLLFDLCCPCRALSPAEPTIATPHPTKALPCRDLTTLAHQTAPCTKPGPTVPNQTVPYPAAPAIPRPPRPDSLTAPNVAVPHLATPCRVVISSPTLPKPAKPTTALPKHDHAKSSFPCLTGPSPHLPDATHDRTNLSRHLAH